MSSISFLLDENITPKAEIYLKNQGFNCKHIVTMGYQGSDDETVLSLAKKYGSCLCTMNGKDFVIQIVPKGENNHFGLFWVIHNVTRKNYIEVFNLVISFVKDGNNMDNTIVKLKEENNVFNIEPYYPKYVMTNIH